MGANGAGEGKLKLVSLTLQQKAEVVKWWKAQPKGTERAVVQARVREEYGIEVSVQALSRMRATADELIEKAECAGAHQLGLKQEESVRGGYR